MKHTTEIIRELLREDEYIRTHEAEIIQYYIQRSASRAGLAARKAPASAKWDEGPRRIIGKKQPVSP
jgi:hypothetical protein